MMYKTTDSQDLKPKRENGRVKCVCHLSYYTIARNPVVERDPSG